MANQSEREKLQLRLNALKNERSSWLTHWQDISTFLLPRSGRFFVQDRNKGGSRTNNIYDSTGTKALRVLAAGMMAGMTSPARPWFRLGTNDPELMKSAAVKQWLNDVTKLLLDVFAKSNTYRSLHGMYEELGAFGTAASIVLPDFDTVLHHYPLTAGEYAVATDHRGKVTTLYREFQKTVGELVGEFGLEAVSTTVRNLYDRGSLDQWVTVIHAIEPREARDAAKRDNKNMPWKSTYFEAGGESDKFLRVSGFNRFPAIVPRWSTTGGDIYGNSPGMEALGDIKQLQHEQLRKAEGIDYKTNPPLQVPTSAKGNELDTLPGGISYVDVAGGGNAIKTMFDVNLDLSHLLGDIQDVRGRINGAFYADLFLMLANQNDARMTATEVAERHEEKLLMLGPVLERLHNELLDPLIDMAFERVMAAGIVPTPPQELQGVNIQVEFVSMLAQAQRAIGTNSIDRFVAGIGQIASVKPEALDKLDADRYVDLYSDLLGVDPSLLLANDKVAIIRQQRAQQALEAQQAAKAEQQARMVKDLSGAKTGDQSVLTDATLQCAGYT